MRAVVAILIWFCARAALAQEFTTLKGHGGPIMDIAVLADGRVATASFDNSVGLWDLGVPIWLEGHEAAVNALAPTIFNTILSGGDDFAIRRWRGDPVIKLEFRNGGVLGKHLGKVTDIAIHPHQGEAASASWDGTIGIWSLLPPPEFGGHIFLEAPSGVNAVAYSDDEQWLYAATVSGELLAFSTNYSAPEFRSILKHGFGINDLVLGEEGAWLAYGAVDGVSRVIDPETGAQIADFTLDRRPILAMAYHADTAQLAVGDGQGYIMMVDTQDWRITRDFRATRAGPVWALAFSPDGQVIYAGGLDDVAYAWPVAYLDEFDPAIDGERSFLRAADTMSNGERQFMRKCSICHALDPAPSRKAGPSLYGLFGRKAGTLPGYPYSATLLDADIVWDAVTVDALFDEGPDHYIPGSKMPMQVIRGADDRADLVEFLKLATKEE